MKLWLSLPLLFVAACGSNELQSESTNSSSARPTGSLSRIKDTGAGIATIKTSHRHIDGAAAGGSSGHDVHEAKPHTTAPQQSFAGQSTDAEDAGPREDAGSPMMSGAGAAGMGMPGMSAMNTGSCCEASDKPGCGTPETQGCVCALQPSCCTTAWTATCTFLVAQKFCQPGVRECVCGNGMGQWRQAACCSQIWSDTCDSVAVNKCNARAGCF